MCIILILASSYFTIIFLLKKSYIKAIISAIITVLLTLLITS